MGVKEKNLTTVSNLLNNYVLSFVADECRFKNAPPDKMREFERMLNQQDRLFFSIPSDFDAQFLYGLQIVFAGLENMEVL